ncbi:hypothetical protein AB0D54_07020 [Streptomyces xanthophaeus]
MASTEGKKLQKSDIDTLKALIGNLENVSGKKPKAAKGAKVFHHYTR